MATQMGVSHDVNLIIKRKRDECYTIKPTTSKFLSDFGVLGFNLKVKFVLRNPLTFFNML